jgi:hypothetical protein
MDRKRSNECWWLLVAQLSSTQRCIGSTAHGCNNIPSCNFSVVAALALSVAFTAKQEVVVAQNGFN